MFGRATIRLGIGPLLVFVNIVHIYRVSIRVRVTVRVKDSST